MLSHLFISMALTLGLSIPQSGMDSPLWLGYLGVVGSPTQEGLVKATSQYQSQPQTQPLLDFDEDDEFEAAGEGFHALYVDIFGNVLGTFVNIPGAKIRVYASGQIAIAEQDYTQEIQYYSNGRIRSIGETRFRYSQSGRIREIDDTEFQYSSNGRLRAIGDVDFNYSSSGRLRAIEDVNFDYRSNGQLDTISADQTRNGIRIVIVD